MIRRLLVLPLLVAAALVGAWSSPAFAAAASPTSHSLALYAQQHHAEIAQAVALAFGFGSSHVTAWTTHWSAPAKLKSTVATVLAVIAGVVPSVIWAPDQPWFDWMKAIFLAVVSGQAAYLLRNLPVLGAVNFQLGGLKLGKIAGAPDVPPVVPTVPNSAPLPDGAP